MRSIVMSHGEVLVAFVRDPATDAGSRRERPFHLDAEPRAEHGGIGQRAPHATTGRADEDLSLDAIGIVCFICNLLAAYYWSQAEP
jgi:hypothetical protein